MSAFARATAVSIFVNWNGRRFTHPASLIICCICVDIFYFWNGEQEIAAFITERDGHPARADRIYLTNGASEGDYCFIGFLDNLYRVAQQPQKTSLSHVLRRDNHSPTHLSCVIVTFLTHVCVRSWSREFDTIVTGLIPRLCVCSWSRA